MQWVITDVKLGYGLGKDKLARIVIQAAVPDVEEDEDGGIRVGRKSILYTDEIG